MAARKKDSAKKTKQPAGSKKVPEKDRKKAAADESKDRPADRKKGIRADDAQTPATVEKRPFPIVGVGASAGGLDALEVFFNKMPVDGGVAFVVVTHTDPKHASLLPNIIQRKTQIEVKEIQDGMAAKPNAVFLPPSDSDVSIDGEVFRLQKRQAKRDLHMPVDYFLKSLAAARREWAGCLIMSGTGSDGTQGLRDIKEKGGVAAVQSPESAKHAGMPNSAIDTGLVDYVAPPREMPERLIEYFKHAPKLKTVADRDDRADSPKADPLKPILSFLSNRTRHDFSQYKRGTLTRRIERRIIVTRSQSAEEYIRLLYRDEREVKTLFQDLLIGVTSFFRDPDAFEQLKKEVLPGLISKSKEGESIRVWVTGCATGEEAYSVAIVLKECLEEINASRNMQIFGTDIDANAIEKARTGEYLPNVVADVSEKRLKRFFSKEGKRFRVKGEIRESMIFAEQNLLRDPPFSDLDLLVCRNLLIYLKPEAQEKVIPLFHYTLKKNGVLFLGSSESIGPYSDLFEPISKQHSIYRKKETAVPPRVLFPTGRASVRKEEKAAEEAKTSTDHVSVAEAVDDILMAEYTPACVVVSEKGEILHTHGRTGKFLELAPGKPNLNITDMAREGLRFSLLSAFRKVKDERKPIRENGLRVKSNGDHHWFDLTVKPYDEPPLEDTLLVVFHERPAPDRPAIKDKKVDETASDESKRVEKLERELLRVREDYRSATEELETSNEELQSTNEEMQSSNEELQSTNEELESSREELQSLNEELNTVNSELQGKIQELDNAYSTITDVLDSTRIAMIFLDTELHLARFTEEAAKLVNLIESDPGRPFEHISHNLKFENLAQKAGEVLKTLSPYEDEVETKDGHWYRMNIMIQRDNKHVISGVVLTLVNIDAQKEAQNKIEKMSRRFTESIVDTVRESLLVLNEDLRVLSANRRFYEQFQTVGGDTEGKKLFELGNGQWDIPKLRKLLEKSVQKRESFEDYLVEHEFPSIGYKKMRLNGRHLKEEDERLNKILLAIEDVTEKK